MAVKRADDFEIRRKHLENLSDEELYERFWKLAEEVAKPLVDLGYNNTTPSIERAVLLRMGFSSMEAKEIVNHTMEKSLMGKGAGNVVYSVSKKLGRNYREVGKEMADGQHWDIAVGIFKGGAN